MRAFLDDQPLPLDRPTLAAALRAGIDAAQREGRIIVEVYLDGQAVPDSVLEDPPDEPLAHPPAPAPTPAGERAQSPDRPQPTPGAATGEVPGAAGADGDPAPAAAGGPGEVRLVSVRPRLLVQETLHDAADAIQRAGEDQVLCAQLIQSGRVEEGLPHLGRAIQTWQAVRDAIERSAALLREPLEGAAGIAFPAEGESQRLADLLESLARRLEELKHALAAEDWSALADCLAYEMPDQVERWRSALHTLAEGLGEAKPRQ